MTDRPSTSGLTRTLTLALLMAASLGLGACNRQSGTTPTTGDGGSSSGATGSSGASALPPSGGAGDTSTATPSAGSGSASAVTPSSAPIPPASTPR